MPVDNAVTPVYRRRLQLGVMLVAIAAAPLAAVAAEPPADTTGNGVSSTVDTDMTAPTTPATPATPTVDSSDAPPPIIVGQARASRWDKPFHGILLTGLTAGGDKLGYVDVANGFNNTERTNLKAGGQVLLAIGAGYRSPDSVLSVQATIGWHSDSVTAGEDRVGFDRFPLELIGFYNAGQHRVGLGATVALGPELDMSDANGDVVEFDDAAGWLVAYDYRWRNLGFGIRYVSLEYDPDTVNGAAAGGDAADGSHVGLMLTIPF